MPSSRSPAEAERRKSRIFFQNLDFLLYSKELTKTDFCKQISISRERLNQYKLQERILPDKYYPAIYRFFRLTPQSYDFFTPDPDYYPKNGKWLNIQLTDYMQTKQIMLQSLYPSDKDTEYVRRYGVSRHEYITCWRNLTQKNHFPPHRDLVCMIDLLTRNREPGSLASRIQNLTKEPSEKQQTRVKAGLISRPVSVSQVSANRTAHNLQYLMRKNHITQTDLTVQSRLTWGQVSKLYAGTRRISPANAKRFSSIFAVPESWFYYQHPEIDYETPLMKTYFRSNTVADNVKRYYSEKKWTVRQLASFAGVSYQTLLSNLSGKAPFSDETISRLARVFQIPEIRLFSEHLPDKERNS